MVTDSVSAREWSRSMAATREVLQKYSSHVKREAQLFEFNMFHCIGAHSQDNFEALYTGQDIGGFHKRFATTFDPAEAQCDDMIHRDFVKRGYFTAYFDHFCGSTGPPEVQDIFVKKFCKDKLAAAGPLADIANPDHMNCDYNDFAAPFEDNRPTDPINTCKCRKLSTLTKLATDALA